MADDHDVMQLRARVAELEAKIEFLYKRLNIAYVKEISEADQKVAEILKRGNTLEAINAYREMHRVDLASAKKAVEELKARLGI